MVGVIFLIMVALSYAELVLLVKVSANIGFLYTVLLCLFTAVVGGSLVKKEGLAVLASLQTELARGKDPSSTILGGVLLFISGIFLVVPGFITDAFGFLCLVGPIRNKMASVMFSRLASSFSGRGSSNSNFKVYTWNSGAQDTEQQNHKISGNEGSQDGNFGYRTTRKPQESDIIDVEFEDR